MVLGYYENRRCICHCMHLAKMSGKKCSRSFSIRSAEEKMGEVVDYNNCIICQDTSEKGLMNIILASVP